MAPENPPRPEHRPAPGPRLATGVAAAALLVALALSAWPSAPPPPVFATRLELLLPAAAELDGWVASRQAVAQSEEMKRAVAELLNFDDAVFAIYARQDVRVAIYAAYWTPGKMPQRLVATHTPDVCWVEGGWRCRERSEAPVSSRRPAGAPVPFEHRVFEQNGRTEHVVFCHFVGDRVQRSDAPGGPPWYAVMRDVFTRGGRQREEQMFVRISSNRPYHEIRDTAPVVRFLDSLLAVVPFRAADRATGAAAPRR